MCARQGTNQFGHLVKFNLLVGLGTGTSTAKTNTLGHHFALFVAFIEKQLACAPNASNNPINGHTQSVQRINYHGPMSLVWFGCRQSKCSHKDNRYMNVCTIYHFCW